MPEPCKRDSLINRLEQCSPAIFFPLILILVIGGVTINNYFHGKQEALNNRHLDNCLQKLENERNIDLLNIKQKMCFQRWGECKP